MDADEVGEVSELFESLDSADLLMSIRKEKKASQRVVGKAAKRQSTVKSTGGVRKSRTSRALPPPLETAVSPTSRPARGMNAGESKAEPLRSAAPARASRNGHSGNGASPAALSFGLQSPVGAGMKARSGQVPRQSRDQITSLMSYLTNVQNDTETQTKFADTIVAQRVTRAKARPRASVRGSVGSSVARDVFGGIKSKVSQIKAKLGEREAEVERLRGELDRRTKEHNAAVSKARLAHRAEVMAQKEEFEAALTRQLAMSDRLLKDKESLNKQYGQLTEKLRETEEKFVKLLDDAARKHKEHLAGKQKMWSAAERARRERWEQEQTAKIKEMTIRGLEPEIQAILRKAKADLKAAEERSKQALEDQRRELLNEKALAIVRAKEQGRLLGVEQSRVLRDEAIRKAREDSTEQSLRLREERAKQEAAIAQERMRMHEELAAERERLRDESRRADRANGDVVKRLRADHAKETTELKRRAKTDLDKARSQLAVEKEQWQKAILAKFRKQARERERVLTETLKKQQDAEVEQLIKRLTEDQESGEREAERRLRETAESRKREAMAKAKEAKEWMEKHIRASERTRVLEAERASMTSRLAAVKLERQQEQARQIELEREVARLRSDLQRGEEGAAARLKKANERVAALEAQTASQANAHKKQVDRVRREAEAKGAREVASLHDMVRKAVGQKDKVIRKLTERLAELEARNEQVEQALAELEG